MENIQKSPIGILPAKIHHEKRFNDVEKAIERYNKAKLPIPLEWSIEYNYLSELINK